LIFVIYCRLRRRGRKSDPDGEAIAPVTNEVVIPLTHASSISPPRSAFLPTAVAWYRWFLRRSASTGTPFRCRSRSCNLIYFNHSWPGLLFSRASVSYRLSAAASRPPFSSACWWCVILRNLSLPAKAITKSHDICWRDLHHAKNQTTCSPRPLEKVFLNQLSLIDCSRSGTTLRRRTYYFYLDLPL